MVTRPTIRRPRKWAWLTMSAILAAIGGYVVWGRTPPTPMAEAYLAVGSDDVLVIDRPWLTMMPLTERPHTGLIFYPGARIDPMSYAPFAEELSVKGYLVVIVPMPVNLAVLGVDKADEVMAVHPTIDTWVIGGHSLGGAMAARYVAKHPQAVDGLLLWAAFPSDDDNLSSSSVQVMSIYATLDGLTTTDEIMASRVRLPATTEFVEIEGGNHAGFGWYGPQLGDMESTIGRPQQARTIMQSTLDFMARVAATD